MKKYALLLLVFTLAGTAQATPRIITLSAALTETVFALGHGAEVVATDVTSASPAAAAKLPHVSRNRSLSAEGLLSFSPTLVLAPENDVPRGLRAQLRAAGIRLVTFRQGYSPEGALAFIRQVAGALGDQAKGETLAVTTQTALNKALAKVQAEKRPKPKVLFIYARGAGTMVVAGKGSSLAAVIELAGGLNAVQEFSDYKPYSTEMLVAADPDVVLLFDFGAESLGGLQGILELPGMSGTKAGRNKRIIQLDGQLLVNFSNLLPQAVTALHTQLYP